MVPALTYSPRVKTQVPSRHTTGQVGSASWRIDFRACPVNYFMKYKVPALAYSPRVKTQVPSALAGLTSEFGMGSGVTLPQEIPRLYIPFFN